MNEPRKRYTKEFKIDAVRLYENSNMSYRQVEEELGIGRGNLHRWQREMNEENIRASPGKGNPRDEEVARLKKENAILREERDILRKAVAIFSVPQK